MDEWMGRLLAITYPVLIICGSGLVGYWMKLRHERRTRADEQRLDELVAQVEALRTDMAAALTEFGERVDFAERLLARGVAPQPEQSKHPTPV